MVGVKDVFATRRRSLIAILIVGALLLGAPILGLVGTLVGMADAYRVIASEQNPTPAELARGADFAMSTTALGLVLSVVGAALVVYSVFGLVRLEKLEREDAGELPTAT